MRRLLLVVALCLLWAAPAQAFSKQTGARTMSDGTSIAYDLYEPDGTPPAGGWPGIVLLHGLGGSKDDMAPLAEMYAAHGYAALAYSATGSGTSTGDLGLAEPDETSDERAIFSYFASLPEVSDTLIGAWGVSYGGGQLWNGLVAGIPYKAAEVNITWTDLASALWPQDVARSGMVAAFATTVGQPVNAAADLFFHDLGGAACIPSAIFGGLPCTDATVGGEILSATARVKGYR